MMSMMMTMMRTMTVNLIMIVMSPQGQEGEDIVDVDDEEEEEEDLLEVMIQTHHPIHLIPRTMIRTLHILITAVATALMDTQLATLEEDERVTGGETG